MDPALLDAVARLAAGNAPRSLAPTPATAPDEPTASDPADPDPSTDPSTPDPATATAEPGDEEEVPETPASSAASAWLEVAADVLGGADVLTLPYGNVDVGAALTVKPSLLELARAQQSTVLASLGIEAEPVLAAPGGYVDARIAGAAPDDVPLLVSDRFFDDKAPVLGDLDGHELIVTSSGAEQGSPGPGPSISAVGLRQRLLAEAAVRALPAPAADVVLAGEEPAPSVSGEPLVVVLPTDWRLSTAEQFFSGLDPDWISFGDLRTATGSLPTEQVSATDLVLPVARERRELEPDTFEAAADLIDTGDTLQRVLVGNTRLGARVTEQALSALSYSLRREQRTARSSLALSRGWLDAKLGSVTISASSGVTLSGDSGTFVVTLEQRARRGRDGQHRGPQRPRAEHQDGRAARARRPEPHQRAARRQHHHQPGAQRDPRRHRRRRRAPRRHRRMSRSARSWSATSSGSSSGSGSARSSSRSRCGCGAGSSPRRDAARAQSPT